MAPPYAVVVCDVRLLRDVSVITASGVGGRSLIYANVPLRAPALGPVQHADARAGGWDDWLAVERELNRSGVFDSPFIARLGS